MRIKVEDLHMGDYAFLDDEVVCFSAMRLAKLQQEENPNIDSIPINEKILETNGFERNACESNIFEHRVDGGCVQYDNAYNMMCYLFDDGGVCDQISEIDDVHQLQQALRLMKTGIEIVIETR